MAIFDRTSVMTQVTHLMGVITENLPQKMYPDQISLHFPNYADPKGYEVGYAWAEMRFDWHGVGLIVIEWEPNGNRLAYVEMTHKITIDRSACVDSALRSTGIGFVSDYIWYELEGNKDAR